MAEFVRIGVRPALYRVNVICWSRQLRLSRHDWQWRIFVEWPIAIPLSSPKPFLAAADVIDDNWCPKTPPNERMTDTRQRECGRGRRLAAQSRSTKQLPNWPPLLRNCGDLDITRNHHATVKQITNIYQHLHHIPNVRRQLGL